MREEILARIMRSVVVNEETGCWEWGGYRDKDGYGNIQIESKHWRVHRLLYSLSVSPEIDGRFVCHRCDNPPCCNPEHLWLGTAADNSGDRNNKGRGAKGFSHGMSRLTESDVVEIRRIACNVKHGRMHTYRELAVAYNIGFNAIRKIVSRKTWTHI